MDRQRRAFVIGALGVIATVGKAWAAAGPPPRPTLAILVFEYTGKDAALEALREGLAQTAPASLFCLYLQFMKSLLSPNVEMYLYFALGGDKR